MGWKIQATYNHLLCGTANSSNFPALVYASAATMKTVAKGGYVANADGSDILFFSDAACTTQIPSEIEFYDGVNGILWAWVQVATLSVSVDGSVWLRAGITVARTTGVWDANHSMVLHLPNGTALSLADSTANANNGSSPTPPTATAGKIDGGAAFASASTQYASVADTASIQLEWNTAFSLEFWIKTTTAAVQLLIEKMDPAGTFRGYQALINGGKIGIALYSSNATSTYLAVTTDGAVNDNAWHHIAVTHSGSGTAAGIAIYVDGSPAAVTVNKDTLGGATIANTQALNIGRRRSSASLYFDGALDEIRLSKGIARAASWWTATRNNGNAPGNIGSAGFWTWGSWAPTTALSVLMGGYRRRRAA